MFCPKCGKEVTNGSRFCSSCGANLDGQVASGATPARPVPPTKSNIQRQAAVKNTTSSGRGWGTASWVFIILQVLLLAFFFINKAFIDFENPSSESILFGGWIVYLFQLPIGLFMIFTETFLGAVFATVQICKKRDKFSWIVFGVACGMLVLMLVLSLTGVFNVGDLVI